MFARALIILTVVAAALASPTRRDVCDTGSLSCCDNIQPAEQSAGTFAGVINLENLSVPVGVTCTPLGILGVATSGTWYVSDAPSSPCV